MIRSCIKELSKFLWLALIGCKPELEEIGETCQPIRLNKISKCHFRCYVTLLGVVNKVFHTISQTVITVVYYRLWCKLPVKLLSYCFTDEE